MRKFKKARLIRLDSGFLSFNDLENPLFIEDKMVGLSGESKENDTMDAIILVVFKFKFNLWGLV